MKNPTSPEDAEEFAGFVDKWVNKLGLTDWRVIRDERPAKGVMAQVQMDIEGRMAVYRLGKHFGGESVTAHTLESTAAHEMIHVLLAEFRNVIECKGDESLIQSAEHRIVHTLERLLVPKA